MRLFIILLISFFIVAMTSTVVIVFSGNRSSKVKDGDSKDDDGTIIPEPKETDLFELSIIHINDFHSRFEETNERSFPCRPDDNCIGGLARTKTVVDRLRAKHKNSIFLNAGDNFQGTFWYNLLRYNVTSYFLNKFKADATVIGNHEFAHRVGGLIPFINMLESPIVVANLNDHYEPKIQGLYKKSVIVERAGRKIGIIGVIFRETGDVANVGELRFTDEVSAIQEEATVIRRQGVNIIIVLSHCGLERDREIAMETGDYVDIIVGGHSHSFLYSNAYSAPGPDTPVGPYPIVMTPKTNTDRKVLIVQASAFTKYVGDLTVYFNAQGHVKYYDGSPIFLSHEVMKDPEIERELIPWREAVDRLGNRLIGHSNVSLINEGCRHGECLLGSFVTDSFVNETRLIHPEIEVFSAIVQSAGFRSSFPVGPITYGDIVSFMPFENTLDILELPGEQIIEMFEHSVSRSYSEDVFIGIHMLQVSGFIINFNVTHKVGQRVVSVQIKINDTDYERIRTYRSYPIIVASFLAAGNDGFSMIKNYRQNHRVGLLDVDILQSSIKRTTPIAVQLDGRITIVT